MEVMLIDKLVSLLQVIFIDLVLAGDWVGLAIISYVAIDMIVRGSLQVAVAIE